MALPEYEGYYEYMRRVKREYLLRLLEECRGKVEVAADLAKVSRSHLYKLLDSANIDRKRKPRRV